MADDNNRSLILKAVIGALLVIFLVVCIIIFAISRRGTTEDTPQEEPVEVTPTSNGPGLPQVTIDPGDPENWDTFIEQGYLFTINYPFIWEIKNAFPENYPAVLEFKASDGSVLSVNSFVNNTRSLKDYLKRLDFARSTELNGQPSVVINSLSEFKVANREAIQRSETSLSDNTTKLIVYMEVPEEGTRPLRYIYTFTILSQNGVAPEQTQVYKSYLDILGTFLYKPYRYNVTGKIVTGFEAGVEWCNEGFYVEFPGLNSSQRQYMYLRNIGTEGYPAFRDRNYLGKKVRIEGIYQPDKILCEALTCDCEDYMIIENINTTNTF